MYTFENKQTGNQYKLVLAEKPSVAQALAKVVGASNRRDGYLEGGGYLVSWCIGHLVGLATPEAYDEKYTKWRRDDLPILPHEWKYRVSPSTQKQFSILQALMWRTDVASLVCATDAGREGELIFRLVYEQCGCRKPVERLWISSMEDTAIREGFKQLKPSAAYDTLYKAALCRERADWLVGINATRLFSCLYGKTLPIGRVMTPTLAMAVEREAKITAFTPEPFYLVQIGFSGCAAVSRRFKSRPEAEALKVLCEKEPDAVIQSVEKKEKSEKAPALYDLTSLQRDANRLLGYTAQQTLDYTQSLYEKKLVTYPRTDSRYLTEDMEAGLPALAENTVAAFGFKTEVSIHPAQVINGKKVSDHHAIIPTGELQKCNFGELPKGELAILQLVAVRLLAALNEPYRYTETALQIQCAGEVFTTKGRTVLQEGWKAIERKTLSGSKPKEAESFLPDVAESVHLPLSKVTLKESQTTPPKHYTEDTLLAAMESAGAEAMPEEAERRGIGTPATRAGIIEKLVQKGLINRVGDKKVQYLIPTEKGAALITVLPEQLQSAQMTAEWEEKLLRIERGEYSPEAFLSEIAEFITALTETSETIEGADVLMPNNIVIGTCPHCGAEVAERQKGWFCANRECRFVLWKDNAYFKRLGKHLTAQMAEKLLRNGRVRLKDCKSQKTGKVYNATALLSTEADGRAKFTLEFENGGKAK